MSADLPLFLLLSHEGKDDEIIRRLSSFVTIHRANVITAERFIRPAYRSMKRFPPALRSSSGHVFHCGLARNPKQLKICLLIGIPVFSAFEILQVFFSLMTSRAPYKGRQRNYPNNARLSKLPGDEPSQTADCFCQSHRQETVVKAGHVQQVIYAVGH